MPVKKCADEVLNLHDERDLLTVLTRWMLDLAKNRPNLFELLYLSDLNVPQTLPSAFMKAENHQKMTRMVSEIHSLSIDDSEDILIRSCVFLMGIGTVISVNQIDVSEETVMEAMQKTVDDFVAGVQRRKQQT